MHPKISQSKTVKFLDRVFYKIWFNLWFESLDKSISSLITIETDSLPHGDTKQRGQRNFLKFFCFGILGVVTAPIGSLVYVAWFLLFRKIFRAYPYNLSVKNNGNTAVTYTNENHYEVLSMNVCLLPEIASKINNLQKTKTRAVEIGNLLSFSSRTTQASRDSSSNVELIEVVHDLVASNKDFDFICLQEVWSIDIGQKLSSILHTKYSHVVYDAAHCTFKLNKYIGLGSGLLIASKYPIVAVDFKQFTNKCGFCSLAGKGLLNCKVRTCFSSISCVKISTVNVHF